MIFIILYQVSERLPRYLGPAHLPNLIETKIEKTERIMEYEASVLLLKYQTSQKTGVNHFDLRTAHAVHIWSCFSILSVELHRHLTSPYEE